MADAQIQIKSRKDSNLHKAIDGVRKVSSLPTQKKPTEATATKPATSQQPKLSGSDNPKAAVAIPKPPSASRSLPKSSTVSYQNGIAKPLASTTSSAQSTRTSAVARTATTAPATGTVAHKSTSASTASPRSAAVSSLGKPSSQVAKRPASAVPTTTKPSTMVAARARLTSAPAALAPAATATRPSAGPKPVPAAGSKSTAGPKPLPTAASKLASSAATTTAKVPNTGAARGTIPTTAASARPASGSAAATNKGTSMPAKSTAVRATISNAQQPTKPTTASVRSAVTKDATRPAAAPKAATTVSRATTSKPFSAKPTAAAAAVKKAAAASPAKTANAPVGVATSAIAQQQADQAMDAKVSSAAAAPVEEPASLLTDLAAESFSSNLVPGSDTWLTDDADPELPGQSDEADGVNGTTEPSAAPVAGRQAETAEENELEAIIDAAIDDVVAADMLSRSAELADDDLLASSPGAVEAVSLLTSGSATDAELDAELAAEAAWLAAEGQLDAVVAVRDLPSASAACSPGMPAPVARCPAPGDAADVAADLLALMAEAPAVTDEVEETQLLAVEVEPQQTEASGEVPDATIQLQSAAAPETLKGALPEPEPPVNPPSITSQTGGPAQVPAAAATPPQAEAPVEALANRAELQGPGASAEAQSTLDSDLLASGSKRAANRAPDEDERAAKRVTVDLDPAVDQPAHAAAPAEEFSTLVGAVLPVVEPAQVIQHSAVHAETEPADAAVSNELAAVGEEPGSALVDLAAAWSTDVEVSCDRLVALADPAAPHVSDNTDSDVQPPVELPVEVLQGQQLDASPAATQLPRTDSPTWLEVSAGVAITAPQLVAEDEPGAEEVIGTPQATRELAPQPEGYGPPTISPTSFHAGQLFPAFQGIGSPGSSAQVAMNGSKLPTPTSL